MKKEETERYIEKEFREKERMEENKNHEQTKEKEQWTRVRIEQITKNEITNGGEG